MKPTSVDEALSRVLAHARPLTPAPRPLDEVFGRVLAEDAVASRPHPPRDDSAMDGYAVRCADLAGAAHGAEVRLPLADEVAAPGCPTTPNLPPGQAMRILTGGPRPHGADAIVRQEATRTEDGQVVFWTAPEPGAHLRHAGEDLALGATVLRAGSELGVGEITALAALGVGTPVVFPRPTVALLTTGDELREPGQPLSPGEIYNSNGPGLSAAIIEAGGSVQRLGNAADTPQAQRSALLAGLQADVLITAGGISVGERDHVASVLESLGTVWHVRGVRMKPGHPASFGVRLRERGAPQLVFGLPGNPAAALVAFEVFVRPALRRLAGHAELLRPRERAQLTAPLEKRGGTTYFVRGTAVREGGRLAFRPFDRQGAGMVTSMIGHDAIACLPPEATLLPAGAEVEVSLHRVPLQRLPLGPLTDGHERGPAVLACVGPSGAGKTTLLEKLLPRLRAEGLRVPVLKRSHHALPADDGKDTTRLRATGADGVALLSPQSLVSHHETPQADGLRAALGDRAALAQALASLFPDANLVLLEGFHEAACAKLLILDDRGPEPRDEALTDVLATVGGPLQTAPRFERDDVEGIAALVLGHARAKSPLSATPKEGQRLPGAPPT